MGLHALPLSLPLAPTPLFLLQISVIAERVIQILLQSSPGVHRRAAAVGRRRLRRRRGDARAEQFRCFVVSWTPGCVERILGHSKAQSNEQSWATHWSKILIVSRPRILLFQNFRKQTEQIYGAKLNANIMLDHMTLLLVLAMIAMVDDMSTK